MTTTEVPRPAPARAMAASNLRRYLVALLSTAYVLAWWLFGARDPGRSAATPAMDPGPGASGQPRVAAWFHDLPPASRPVVALPAGWHIADRTAPSPDATMQAVPVPVRVSPARAGRIRTRSS